MANSMPWRRSDRPEVSFGIRGGCKRVLVGPDQIAMASGRGNAAGARPVGAMDGGRGR